eukprot:scaffold657917_cov62-Prasinocladus_malaysianus.AAC.1
MSSDVRRCVAVIPQAADVPSKGTAGTFQRNGQDDPADPHIGDDNESPGAFTSTAGRGCSSRSQSISSQQTNQDDVSSVSPAVNNSIANNGMTLNDPSSPSWLLALTTVSWLWMANHLSL